MAKDLNKIKEQKAKAQGKDYVSDYQPSDNEKAELLLENKETVQPGI